MPNQNLAYRRALLILIPLLVISLVAGAAPKTATQIPSIQAPQQPAVPKAPAQIPSIQAPSQPSVPAGQPAAGQAPGAQQPAPRDVPVMVPVATTQRDLSPEVQKNLKLLTTQTFPLEARQIGAAGLLQQGSAAVSALRQILSSQPAPIVVQAVAMAIPEIKDPPAELIDPLVQQLSVDETDVRNAVVAALISYRDHDLPARLRTVAANLQNSQAARLAAVTVLNQLADRDSIETLIYLLDTPDEVIRQSSLNALGQMTGVNYGFDGPRWQQWWQTNRNRKPQEWAKPVIAALKEENRKALEDVNYLREQLAKMHRKLYSLYPNQEDRTKHIIDCLAHPVPDVKLVGIELVNNLIPMVDRKSISPEVADQLRKLISDPDPRVRLQAVPVLGDLRNPEDAKLLVDALTAETDAAIRDSITRALGLLHNGAAIPVLLEKLNKGDAALAAASAAGLSLLCQKTDRTASAQQVDQVVTALKARMESASDKALRQAVLDAMARIADERFREQFLAALQSPEPAQRQSAVKAFADLNGPEDAEKVLAPQLADPETVVREAVCAALGKVGKPSQLGLLLQHCDEKDEQNLAVRRAAEDAAISIMLHMDRPLLRPQIEPLTATPNQVLALATVLKRALVQVGQNSDSLLQKAAAAELWVKVVLLQPTDTAAIGMLAKVLVELGNAESLAGTVQRIAADQGSALASVLTALGKEMQAARGTSQPGEVAQALRKLDISTWSAPNQKALAAFLEACSGPAGASGSSSTGPVGSPTATAPATMAGRPQP